MAVVTGVAAWGSGMAGTSTMTTVTWVVGCCHREGGIGVLGTSTAGKMGSPALLLLLLDPLWPQVLLWPDVREVVHRLPCYC